MMTAIQMNMKECTDTGSAVFDEYGVCDGDNSSCADECGVPNGDNSTCADECGIPNGGNYCADDIIDSPFVGEWTVNLGNVYDGDCVIYEGYYYDYTTMVLKEYLL